MATIIPSNNTFPQLDINNAETVTFPYTVTKNGVLDFYIVNNRAMIWAYVKSSVLGRYYMSIITGTNIEFHCTQAMAIVGDTLTIDTNNASACKVTFIPFK